MSNKLPEEELPKQCSTIIVNDQHCPEEAIHDTGNDVWVCERCLQVIKNRLFPFRQSEGKLIRFTSERTIKGNPVAATLLSFNKDHIQVRLEKEVHSVSRVWAKGTVRLFDLDKISNLKLIDRNEYQSHLYKDNEDKPVRRRRSRNRA